MTIVEEERGLEWSHVHLYDRGAEEELPDWDPEAQVVFATSSTLILRGLPEGEGDVVIRLCAGEAADTGGTPVLLATGAFAAPSGDLVARTSSWDEPMRLSVPPGSYRFSVHADDGQWPRRLTVRFDPAS